MFLRIEWRASPEIYISLRKTTTFPSSESRFITPRISTRATQTLLSVSNSNFSILSLSISFTYPWLAISWYIFSKFAVFPYFSSAIFWALIRLLTNKLSPMVLPIIWKTFSGESTTRVNAVSKISKLITSYFSQCFINLSKLVYNKSNFIIINPKKPI